MNRFRKFIAVAVLVALVVMAVTPAAAKVTVVFLSAGDPGSVEELLTRKVNEYEGQHRLIGDQSGFEALLTRKVNEYEGQH